MFFCGVICIPILDILSFPAKKLVLNTWPVSSFVTMALIPYLTPPFIFFELAIILMGIKIESNGSKLNVFSAFKRLFQPDGKLTFTLIVQASFLLLITFNTLLIELYSV